jgi:hypothetical protein
MQFTKDAKGNTILEVKGPTVSPQDIPSGAVDTDNFITFEKLNSLNVKAGSDPDTWELPKEIGVITSKSPVGANYRAKVTWDTSGYDAENREERQMVLKGTVIMPEGVDNLGDLSLVPELCVTIKDEIDTSNLESLIGMIEEMKERKDDYTADSWQRLEEKLSEAKKLIEEPILTQNDVDDMFLSLMDSYLNLTKGVQKTGLKAAIDYADGLLADEEEIKKYTGESITALKEALETAKEVYKTDYEDVAEGQKAVNQAANDLIESTIHLIEQKTADRERLQKLVDYVKSILKNTESYTDESVNALEETLSDAIGILENEEASSQELTDAYQILADALLNLEIKSNKSELQNAIEMANEILNNADKYTDGSLKGIEASLHKAQAVNRKNNATQEEVNAALKDLIQECMDARLKGDINQDGEVDSKDAVQVLRAATELTELSEGEKEAADVNMDGKTGTDDASSILQYVAEAIEKF